MDMPYRLFYFVTIGGILLDARVDKCLERTDYTAALANVDVTGSTTDETYDAFVYPEDNTEDLIEYE